MTISLHPLLTARYQTGYRTMAFSGGWGRWQTDSKRVLPEYHHDPERLLPNGERDIASVYMPVVGPYDSGDPDLCEYHILLAKSAGIDGFLVDWFGPEMTGAQAENDSQVQALMRMAEELEFKIALTFSDHACFPPLQPASKTREQALVAAQKALVYAQDKYFSSSAYLRWQGRPLLALQNDGPTSAPGWSTPFFTAAEWDKIRSGLKENIFLTQNYLPGKSELDFTEWDSVYPGLPTYLGEYDTDEKFWEKCAQALGKKRYQLISGLVTPGYDDRGCGGREGNKPLILSRRQGEKYSATWEDNLAQGAQFIQIGTWNDHNWGTGIEPVKEMLLHKNAAVPGWGYRELLTTREYTLRFRQHKLWPLPAIFLPERLYRLRKSGAPASRGDRIRLYLLEGDITGSSLGLEHAGV
jgi:glycoprotein endo-alpha-1,2-mannosidase